MIRCKNIKTREKRAAKPDLARAPPQVSTEERSSCTRRIERGPSTVVRSRRWNMPHTAGPPWQEECTHEQGRRAFDRELGHSAGWTRRQEERCSGQGRSRSGHLVAVMDALAKFYRGQSRSTQPRRKSQSNGDVLSTKKLTVRQDGGVCNVSLSTCTHVHLSLSDVFCGSEGWCGREGDGAAHVIPELKVEAYVSGVCSVWVVWCGQDRTLAGTMADRASSHLSSPFCEPQLLRTSHVHLKSQPRTFV